MDVLHLANMRITGHYCHRALTPEQFPATIRKRTVHLVGQIIQHLHREVAELEEEIKLEVQCRGVALRSYIGISSFLYFLFLVSTFDSISAHPCLFCLPLGWFVFERACRELSQSTKLRSPTLIFRMRAGGGGFQCSCRRGSRRRHRFFDSLPVT